MSSIQDTNLANVAAPSRRPTSDAPAATPAEAPSAAPADRLQATHRPEAPADPAELVARIKALQTPEPTPPALPQPTAVWRAPQPSVPMPPSIQRRFTPQGIPDRASDYLSPLLNLAIGVLASPRYAVKKAQDAITTSHRLVQGAGKVRDLATGFRAAQRHGHGLNFVRGQFQRLTVKATSHAKEAFELARAHKGRRLLSLFAKTKPADLALNKGVLGFFSEARAAGSGPVRAAWRGFTRTVETGGQMPAVAKQAAQMGGRWGKALTWTGRIGRVAPLLNVPLAVFDVREAVNTWKHPHATTQDKVSKTGQAALTSAAGALAVAGFLAPPPLNAMLLTASGTAGVASMVWSVATSELAVGAYKKIGGFFGDVGKRLGFD